MVFFTILSSYVGLFCGLLLGRVSSEELSSAKVYIKVLSKACISVGAILFSYVFLEPLFGAIGIITSGLIGVFFWKVHFSKQLIVFFWPLAAFAVKDNSLFIFILGLFVLYLIIIGTQITAKYIDKKDPYSLNISYLELIKKGIKKTNLLLISYFICFILQLL